MGYHTHKFPASDLEQGCGGCPCALVQAVGLGIMLSVLLATRRVPLLTRRVRHWKCPGLRPTQPPKMATGKGRRPALTFFCHSAQKPSPLRHSAHSPYPCPASDNLALGLLISALSPVLCGASAAGEDPSRAAFRCVETDTFSFLTFPCFFSRWQTQPGKGLAPLS